MCTTSACPARLSNTPSLRHVREARTPRRGRFRTSWPRPRRAAHAAAWRSLPPENLRTKLESAQRTFPVVTNDPCLQASLGAAGGPLGWTWRRANKFTRPPPRREGEGGRTGRAIGHPAGAGYGGIAPAAWLAADTGPIKEAGGARRESGAAAAACTVEALAAKWSDQDELMKVVDRFALDEMILKEEWLHGATGLASAEFFYLVACLEAAAGVDPDGPLFSGGAGAGPAHCSGGPRILAADHMLCMTLFKMWTGCAIEALPAVFKVDLPTALRNVALAEDALANTGILPTDRAIMGELAGAAPRGGALAAAAAAGGAVSADWTQVQVEPPAGRGGGGGARPGGAAATTYRTLVGCGADGIIVFRGPALAGGRGRDRVPAAPPAGRGTRGRLPSGRGRAGRRARQGQPRRRPAGGRKGAEGRRRADAAPRAAKASGAGSS